MRLDLLPAAMRGAALEGRDRFPIVYDAGDDADGIVGRLAEVIEQGGLSDVFDVSAEGGIVTIDRVGR